MTTTMINAIKPHQATLQIRSRRASAERPNKSSRSLSLGQVLRATIQTNQIFPKQTSSNRSNSLSAIAMPSPETQEMNDEIVYRETGKWRQSFDLHAWAKEIREVCDLEYCFMCT